MRLESVFGIALWGTAGLSIVAWLLGFVVGSRAKDWSRAGGAILFVAFVLFMLLIGGTYPLAQSIGPAVSDRAALIVVVLDAALIGGFGAGRKQQRRSTAGIALYLAVTALVVVPALRQFASENAKIVAVGKQLGYDTLAPHKITAEPADCAAHLKQLYQAFSVYTQDWQALPPAANWTENSDLSSVTAHPEWLHCPALPNGSFGYAYNDAVAGLMLNGKAINQIPNAATTPLLYDSSVPTRNAHDRYSSLPKPGRHAGKDTVLYCDGHTATVTP